MVESILLRFLGNENEAIENVVLMYQDLTYNTGLEKALKAERFPKVTF